VLINSSIWHSLTPCITLIYNLVLINAYTDADQRLQNFLMYYIPSIHNKISRKRSRDESDIQKDIDRFESELAVELDKRPIKKRLRESTQRQARETPKKICKYPNLFKLSQTKDI